MDENTLRYVLDIKPIINTISHNYVEQIVSIIGSVKRENELETMRVVQDVLAYANQQVELYVKQELLEMALIDKVLGQ